MSPDMSSTTATLLSVVVASAFLSHRLTTVTQQIRQLLTPAKGDA